MKGVINSYQNSFVKLRFPVSSRPQLMSKGIMVFLWATGLGITRMELLLSSGLGLVQFWPSLTKPSLPSHTDSVGYSQAFKLHVCMQRRGCKRSYVVLSYHA